MGGATGQLAFKNFALGREGEISKPLHSVPSPKSRRPRTRPQKQLSELSPDDLRTLFQSNEKYEPVLRYAYGREARIALFYHAAYLENFGRSAPYSPIPAAVIEHIASVLGENNPAPFKYPDARQTFFDHADKARRLLGWRQPDARTRRQTQTWLFSQACRLDDPDHLEQVLTERFRAERITLPAQTNIDRLVSHAREGAQGWLSETVTAALTRQQLQNIVALRQLKPSSHRTILQWLKDPIALASPAILDDLLDRVETISAVNLPTDVFERIHPDMRRQIAKVVQIYSVDNLYADFPAKRCQSYIACYLFERKKELIDFAIEVFDDVVEGMYRRSRAARDDDQLKQSPSLNRLFQIMARPMLDEEGVVPTAIRPLVFGQVPRDALAQALAVSEGLVKPDDDDNCFPYLNRRYTYLRSFFPRFISAVGLDSLPTTRPILDAVATLRALDDAGVRKIPAGTSTDFVPPKWRAFVVKDGGDIDRHSYETCAMLELRRVLQSGEVWVRGGRRYGNVEDLLIPKDTWEKVRRDYYKELGLPKNGKAWLSDFLPKLATTIETTVGNQPTNDGLFVEDGRVHIHSLEAEPLSERTKKLKERIEASYTPIRIQDLLVQVDSWIDFLGRFRTPRGRRAKRADFLRGLLATLIAKGCNIGLVKMASLAPSIRPGTLQRNDEVYLHERNLRGAIIELLGAHHDLPIAALLGNEAVSMSDGMRVTSRVKTIKAALMPQLLGPGERALTYYFHVSHQGPGFGAQVIGSDRDAAYVIDQIFHIQSELPIHEHCIDTHGITENTFSLAYPFGIDFTPRIKGIHSQQLYCPPGMKVSGPFKEHFAGHLNTELIEQQWDDYVRALASIKQGTTSAVLLCQRLSSRAEHSPIYRVMREIGRAIKTHFIMRYYDDAALRRRINTALNRMELFNFLARHLFYARRGENWERDFEQQLNRASALMVLTNACVLWNAVHLSEVFQRLQAEGFEFEPEDFAHVSPYVFEHIIPYGQYFFDLRRKERRDALKNARRLQR